jgi:hypothetical protein
MRIAFARWRSGGLFNRPSPRKRLLPKKKTSSGFEFVSGLADGASAMPAKWSRPVFSFGFYERKISRAFGRDPAKFGIEGWLRMHSPAPQDWAAAANAARAWNPGMTKSGPAAGRSRPLLVQATRSGAAVPFSSTASRFSRARCPPRANRRLREPEADFEPAKIPIPCKTLLPCPRRSGERSHSTIRGMA